jgi:hypothetical protein
MAADTQTDLAIDFKAAGRGEEAERWRTERVGRGEDYSAVVEAAGVGRRRGGAADCEVPFEEVVL